MKSNLFVTSDSPLKELQVRTYSPASLLDPGEAYSHLKGCEGSLLRRGILATMLGNEVLAVPTSSLPLEVPIGKTTFKLQDTSRTLYATSDAQVLAALVQNALKRTSANAGYTQHKQQKLFTETPFKTDALSYYHALEYDVEVFFDGNVGVWLDPSTVWRQPVANFIQGMKLKGAADLDIGRALVGRQVYCPSVGKNRRFTAEIAEVSFKPLAMYELPEQNTNLFAFWSSPQYAAWLRRNNVALDQNDSPVVVVNIPGMAMRPAYPAKLLEIVIDLSDTETMSSSSREKKTLKPQDRINQTLKLKADVLGKGIPVGSMTLNFAEMHDWSTSNYGKSVPLPTPSLVFGNNQRCRAWSPQEDPNIRSALQRNGPVTRKVSVPVLFMVPKEAATKVPKFIENLNKYSRALNLSEFVLSAVVELDDTTPDRYRTKAALLSADQKKAEVVLVVLPRYKPTDAYYAAKRGLGQQALASQMIHADTFSKVANDFNAEATANVLSLEIYDKSLKSGEAVWHLESPAGGISADKAIYFMGFDVSRNPEHRREAAAYAAICDSYGRVLHRKAIDTHKGEKIQWKVLSDWFFEVALAAYQDTAQQRKLDDLMLFKDGPIPPSQVGDYKRAALDAKERLVKENLMNLTGNIRIISVVKRGPHRIYGEPTANYKIQNVAIVRDKTSALLLTASSFIGTPSTLRVRIVYQIIDDMQIEQVLRIFNDLRFLDWSSLYKQPKTILPLHIVQNLAILSKEDIVVPYTPH